MSGPGVVARKIVDAWRVGGPAEVSRALRRTWRRRAYEGLDATEEYRRWLVRHERRLFSPIPGPPPSTLVVVRAREDDVHAIARTRASVADVAESDFCVVPRGGALPDVAGQELVVVVREGDVFRPHALGRLAAELPREGLVYADEDRIASDGGPTSPRLKPAFSPVLARHSPAWVPGAAAAYSAPVWRRVLADGARTWLDASVAACASAREIVHLPVPLLSRATRTDEEDTLAAPSPDPPSAGARVSIVIPTRDRPDLLAPLLRSLASLRDVEVVLVDHGTRDPVARSLLQQAERDLGARIVAESGPFNFSRLANRGAAATTSDLVLFLNNDVEPRSLQWLDRLVAAMEPGVAAVGPLLLYPDGRVQHAGIALGVGTVAAHLHRRAQPDDPCPVPSPRVPREMSALSGACLLVRKDVFRDVGGFDEENLPVSFNDVDLALRLRAAGWRLVFEPRAVLIHHETSTRAARLDPREIVHMLRTWPRELRSDPYLPPGLSRTVEIPHLELWEDFSVEGRPSPRSRA